jgi:hypothetical protein
MCRPYLFLRHIRLRNGILLIGRDGEIVKMSQVTEVSSTRLLRPHAVCLTVPSYSKRKIWFLAEHRWTRMSAEHPVVRTLLAMAADARMKERASTE